MRAPQPSDIGQTRNEILTKMNQHRQNGAILEHMSAHHDIGIYSRAIYQFIKPQL